MKRVLLIYLENLDNEPLGLMYIGTVLKKQGYSVKIIGLPNPCSKKYILKETSDFSPLFIGISITTPQADYAQTIARIIKENFPKSIIVAGGPHPTILPFETLREGNIDLCVLGEGELTILELADVLARPGDLRNVRGIAYLKDGHLVFTEQREFIKDLDSLPFVDRELLPKSVIYGRAGYPLGNPCMLLITGRGCLFRCSFCQPTVKRMFGEKMRRRSVENVLAEISQLKERYGIKGLWINDDTFCVDRNWVKKFCSSLIERRIDVMWYANGRFNFFDEEILTLMRNSGCCGLVMTPEVGSQRVRNEILNKDVTDEAIISAYQICKKVGIPFQANIMFASPTETGDELNASFSLIKKIQPHFMNLSYTTALPGTHLYDRYLSKIKDSIYYQSFSDFDIGRFKKLECDIDDKLIQRIHHYFQKYYDNTSFRNRARHFLRYPYFRKIILKRWSTLIFNKHPNFLHLGYDIISII